MRTSVVILVLLVILFCPGCVVRYVYVEARHPILECPVRPRLLDIPGTEMKKMSEPAQKAVGDNFDALIMYATKLEAAVTTYNDFANERNKANGYGTSLPDIVKEILP